MNFFLEGSNNKLYHHNSRHEQNKTLTQLQKNIPPVETGGIKPKLTTNWENCLYEKNLNCLLLSDTKVHGFSRENLANKPNPNYSWPTC
jgi:hypothetical protein